MQLYCTKIVSVYLASSLSWSIQSKKGKSGLSQREVNVIMPNEQCVAVKCDIKSHGRDVFDMVVAHANLVEHFYFGLAFIDGNSVFIYAFVCSCVVLMTLKWTSVCNVHFKLSYISHWALIIFLSSFRWWIFLFGPRDKNLKGCPRLLEESGFCDIYSFSPCQIFPWWHLLYIVCVFYRLWGRSHRTCFCIPLGCFSIVFMHLCLL